KSKLVISHDTGLMHIAAALKKPVIAVWGNTMPLLGVAPYYGNAPVLTTKFEVDKLSCRPCSKIGRDKCPKGHFKCMMLQDVEAIAATAQAWAKELR
ncbi:MAG TPA: glycosyltransferase family 9 protein, partial [Lacibacter sp.]|nr:glycosyltransferase family 9 protein [Lacibacter sp.]